jgi:hypothetical protein
MITRLEAEVRKDRETIQKHLVQVQGKLVLIMTPQARGSYATCLEHTPHIVLKLLPTL